MILTEQNQFRLRPKFATSFQYIACSQLHVPHSQSPLYRAIWSGAARAGKALRGDRVVGSVRAGSSPVGGRSRGSTIISRGAESWLSGSSSLKDGATTAPQRRAKLGRASSAA